jgi:hypothetical protein
VEEEEEEEEEEEAQRYGEAKNKLEALHGRRMQYLAPSVYTMAPCPVRQS